MDKDLLAVRWATFVGLIAVATVYLFPRLLAEPAYWLVGGLLILLAAALLTFAVESGLRFVVKRLPPPAAPVADDGGWITRFNEDLFAAQDASQVVMAVLRSGRGLLRASGASFISFDEWGGSFPPLTDGELPQGSIETLLQMSAARQVCRRCTVHRGEAPDCVLATEGRPAGGNVICLPLRENGREIGAVNYFGASVADSPNLGLVASSAEMALSSMRRRDREIAALRHLQASSSQQDLPGLLRELSQTLAPVLGAEAAYFWLPDGLPEGLSAPILIPEAGITEDADHEPLSTPFLTGVWQSVGSSHAAVALESLFMGEGRKPLALLAVPLAWRDEPAIGLLLLLSVRPLNLTERQMLLVQTLAGEAALIVENSRLMVRVQYRAVVDERTRLAREIHDGLAQTLAFLKIQAALMQHYLQQGKLDRLEETLSASHQTLGEAYKDARQAIDNLRSVPETSTREWLLRVARDFEMTSGVQAEVVVSEIESELPPTAQAQLIRIVQEALSNIRKHANARRVVITAEQRGATLLLEVRDDGTGFEPSQLGLESQYGILGMRERAELIGALLHIQSDPGAGTLIQLEIPLGVQEKW